MFDRRRVPDGASFRMVAAKDGWPLRRFDWPQTGAARGSILFQTGRGDMIEKYFETCAHWHAQGWSITAFDWRGQGGSGRLAVNPHVGHIHDFETWTLDLRVFWTEWKAQTVGPHVIMGHSMGGHLVLRTLIEGGVDPDATVLSAPMLGFETGMLPVRWVAQLVGILAKYWPERRAWPQNERPSLPGEGRQKFLTHDRLRYDDESWWRAQKPELVLGPPSLGWLAAAYASTLWTEEEGKLENLDTPILIVGTDADKLVSPSAIRRIASRIKNVRLKMWGAEASHEILREVDAVRDAVLSEIDLFLGEAAPAQ
jgi:lysophospholipase